jgi:hypothetical protein
VPRLFTRVAERFSQHEGRTLAWRQPREGRVDELTIERVLDQILRLTATPGDHAESSEEAVFLASKNELKVDPSCSIGTVIVERFDRSRRAASFISECSTPGAVKRLGGSPSEGHPAPSVRTCAATALAQPGALFPTSIGQRQVKEPTERSGTRRNSCSTPNRASSAKMQLRAVRRPSLTRKRSEVQIL